jgi:hypothetical protein
VTAFVIFFNSGAKLNKSFNHNSSFEGRSTRNQITQRNWFHDRLLWVFGLWSNDPASITTCLYHEGWSAASFVHQLDHHGMSYKNHRCLLSSLIKEPIIWDCTVKFWASPKSLYPNPADQ